MAAEDGNAFAQGMVGYLYQNGIGVSASRKDGLEWVTKGAEAGDGYAQSLLGYMYGCCVGVKRDYAQALKWHLRAARQVVPFSQGDAARYYNKGMATEVAYGPAL